MKKHLIEILKIVWRYGRFPGGAKLGNTCLSALVFPAETILFQKVADDILHLLNQSRAALCYCSRAYCLPCSSKTIRPEACGTISMRGRPQENAGSAILKGC